MLGLKLNHVSKRGYWQQAITWANVDSDLCYHMASLGLFGIEMLYTFLRFHNTTVVYTYTFKFYSKV